MENLYNETYINKIDTSRNKIIIFYCLIVSALFASLFLSIFFANYQMRILFIILSSLFIFIFFSLTTFFVIYLSFYREKKKHFLRVSQASEESVDGIVNSVGEIETYKKGIRCFEISIESRIIYADEDFFSQKDFVVSDKYLFLIRDNFLVGFEKNEKIF